MTTGIQERLRTHMEEAFTGTEQHLWAALWAIQQQVDEAVRAPYNAVAEIRKIIRHTLDLPQHGTGALPPPELETTFKELFANAQTETERNALGTLSIISDAIRKTAKTENFESCVRIADCMIYHFLKAPNKEP